LTYTSTIHSTSWSDALSRAETSLLFHLQMQFL
jgi:hypothetical protein